MLLFEEQSVVDPFLQSGAGVADRHLWGFPATCWMPILFFFLTAKLAFWMGLLCCKPEWLLALYLSKTSPVLWTWDSFQLSWFIYLCLVLFFYCYSCLTPCLTIARIGITLLVAACLDNGNASDCWLPWPMIGWWTVPLLAANQLWPPHLGFQPVTNPGHTHIMYLPWTFSAS